jgi:hypothetical protein
MTGQSPQRVFGHKYPPAIKTNAFTPAMTIPESPMTPASGFGGAFARTPGTDGSAHGSYGENLNAAGEETNPLLSTKAEKAVPPRLGSNIYAGNLKMIAKADEEAEKRAAAKLKPKEPVSVSEKSN